LLKTRIEVEAVSGRNTVAPPVRHPLSEKRRIVELTFEPGASVAQVAQAHGVNANQVFKWRRAFKRGELLDPAAAASTALLLGWSAARASSEV